MTAVHSYFIPAFNDNYTEDLIECCLTGDFYPECEMYSYDWDHFRKSKIEDYLDWIGVSGEEREIIKKEILK